MSGRAAAVDIGTNSVRLLIAERGADGGMADVLRREEVTGLGRGADRFGRLERAAMERTVRALAEYGGEMRRAGAARARAVATAAVRNTPNREEFLEAAAGALGFRPECVTGEEEGRLAFAGATWGRGDRKRTTVVDIGGGSVEFITSDRCVSADIGSVSLTERFLPDHPAREEQVVAAKMTVASLFNRLGPPARDRVTGAAGTWTSVASLLGRPAGTEVGLAGLLGLIDRLAGMTLPEKRALPGLDPRRAPVILGGAVAAAGALQALGRPKATISARDLLDGAVRSLLG